MEVIVVRNCDEIGELLDLYIDKELSSAEAEDIQEHLKFCQGCRIKYEQLCNVKEVLKNSALELPENLHENVIKEIKNNRKKQHGLYYAIAAGFAGVIIISISGIYFNFISGGELPPISEMRGIVAFTNDEYDKIIKYEYEITVKLDNGKTFNDIEKIISNYSIDDDYDYGYEDNDYDDDYDDDYEHNHGRHKQERSFEVEGFINKNLFDDFITDLDDVGEVEYRQTEKEDDTKEYKRLLKERKQLTDSKDYFHEELYKLNEEIYEHEFEAEHYKVEITVFSKD